MPVLTKTRMKPSLRNTFVCQGGPLENLAITLTIPNPSTAVFRLHGMTGFYSRVDGLVRRPWEGGPARKSRSPQGAVVWTETSSTQLSH